MTVGSQARRPGIGSMLARAWPRRTLLAAMLPLLAGAGVQLAAAEARAQAYPSRSIVMLVGYAAGGGADALARITAMKLSTLLGQ